jgi:hypothetical protein
MDIQDPNRSVLRLVNLARAAYGAVELKSLLTGQPHSASGCVIGRSLRWGVEDWLFVAVGSKYLRLWALGKDWAAIAEQVLTAWGTGHLLTQPGEKSGCAMLALPAEIREFIYKFDRGLLPDYQGEVDEIEMRRLSELARKMPILVGRRNTWGNSHSKGQSSPSIREARVEGRPGLRAPCSDQTVQSLPSAQ